MKTFKRWMSNMKDAVLQNGHTRVYVAFDHADPSERFQYEKKLRSFDGIHFTSASGAGRVEKIGGFSRHWIYDVNSPRSAKARRAMERQLKKASRLVVLAGPHAAASRWMAWQIKTFCRLQKKKSNAPVRPADLICGMRLPKCPEADYPALLKRLKGVTLMDWNLDMLKRWVLEGPVEEKAVRLYEKLKVADRHARRRNLYRTCSYCGKVQSKEDGLWRSQSEFKTPVPKHRLTHGICPVCQREFEEALKNIAPKPEVPVRVNA